MCLNTSFLNCVMENVPLLLSTVICIVSLIRLFLLSFQMFKSIGYTQNINLCYRNVKLYSLRKLKIWIQVYEITSIGHKKWEDVFKYTHIYCKCTYIMYMLQNVITFMSMHHYFIYIYFTITLTAVPICVCVHTSAYHRSHHKWIETQRNGWYLIAKASVYKRIQRLFTHCISVIIYYMYINE
jgi:hypothetical protein